MEISSRNMRIGKYQIIDKIGEGGMAEVLLARRESAGGIAKICIVKRIRPELAHRPEFENAFFDEARIALSLSHGNLVQTFDFGRETGSLFLAMEYCDAGDLEDLMGELARRGERMPIGAACHVAAEFLAGLAYAHDAADAFDRPLQLVHRDISPSNVLMTKSGEVKLSDFGIARAAERLVSTGFGRVKGKAAYLSPEQAAGRSATTRSDLFSAGILLWEMIAGRRLFSGSDDRQILDAVLSENIPRPDRLRADCPPGLTAVILRALSVDPVERFPTAGDFLDAIDRFRREERLDFGKTEFARFLEEHRPRTADAPSEKMRTPALPPADSTAPTSVRKSSIPGFSRRWIAVALCAVAFFVGAAFFFGRMTQHQMSGADRTRSQNVIPDPIRPASDEILLTALPDIRGVLIAVDGRPAGFTPVRSILPAGGNKKKKISAGLPGLPPLFIDVALKGGTEKSLPKNLRFSSGRVPFKPEEPVTAAGKNLAAGEIIRLPEGLYRMMKESGEVEYLRIGRRALSDADTEE